MVVVGLLQGVCPMARNVLSGLPGATENHKNRRSAEAQDYQHIVEIVCQTQ